MGGKKGESNNTPAKAYIKTVRVLNKIPYKFYNTIYLMCYLFKYFKYFRCTVKQFGNICTNVQYERMHHNYIRNDYGKTMKS